MFKRSLVTALTTALLLGSVFFGGVAAANTYGSDNYGACAYGKGCSHTVVTTPSGLEIAVNLVDHQVIAAGGYDVTITPLNGSGSSFQKVDIYIDDVLLGTVLPGSDGTAHWHWDTLQHDGQVIKFVATDQTGQTATQSFHFTISAPQSNPQDSGKPTGSANTKGSGGGIFHTLFVAPIQTLAAVTSSFVSGSKSIIKGLPQPVVVAFPWLLFVVLAVEIIYLLGRTRRELRELRTLKLLLQQEQLISELKQGFLMLLSHYLRTPQTILKSGAEGLSSDGTPPDVAKSIQSTAAAFGSSIEALIDRIDSEGKADAAVSPVSSLEHLHTRQRLIIWVPVVLIGLLAAGFVYLAASVHKYSPSVFVALTQLLIYVGLVLAIAFSLRRLQLDRRDRHNAQAVLDDATAAQNRRDEIIDAALLMLNQYMRPLKTSVQGLPATSPNAKFVTNGLSQLSMIRDKFAIASNLKGSRSRDPEQTVSLKELLNQAQGGVASKAEAKKVSIAFDDDMTFVTQNRELTSLVLNSLIDNAVAYSPENSTVHLQGRKHGDRASISVIDNGSGIPDDRMASLFQPLSKVEGAEVFNHEGMGFSLYLDKLIMNYLGGDIDMQSRPGKQTEASFTLPLKPQAA